MDRQKAKHLVIKAGFELVNSGLIARTWGNVSCRIDDKTFVITPSGRSYSTLRPEDIVEVSISDLSYQGSIKPSSEKGIHAEVYRQFPNINFVVHTHQEKASALSAAGLGAIPVPEVTPTFSREVLCAKYALPGTKALRKNVSETLGQSKSNAVILKNHGALCYGKDYDSTLKTAYDLEDICRDFIDTKSREDGLSPSEPIDDTAPIPSLLKEAKKSILAEKGGYVVLNTDPDVIRYSHMTKPLRPYLDDFAQIIGLKASIVENNKSLISKALSHSSAVFIKTPAHCVGGKMKWMQKQRA
ncbi:class II aldolase/adducin family protein [Tepidanaerobacter sp. GT38]|uniref:class II aldolase/adducin family protein n=1 Tax=Tepidanaerobacter sp. GT38 TaxID=2722793 RepID=UPI001F2AD6FB|nr:class II aldolase/adducin family protein [Tepidanaerobacter sp. GT38]MCG1012043.1 class II aldolase/adducin family protein [Tepidanaerobacter sp. GT38]